MLTIFILLIILSAFFSSLETAFFHLKSNNKLNKTTRELLKHPKKLLASLLTGNTIVNIALGSIGASYALSIYNRGLFNNISLSVLLLLEVMIVTVIILIFGEVLPKTYAISKSEKLANFSSKFLKLVMKIIYPFTFIFYSITKLIIKVLPIKKNKFLIRKKN